MILNEDEYNGLEIFQDNLVKGFAIGGDVHA